MITLEVTVRGGIPPMPIKVHIDKLGSSDDRDYESQTSFSRSHDLTPGNYILIVTGMNPEGGNTVVNLTGDFVQAPSPNPPEMRATRIYSVPFFFVI
jgi:hypothetical protein